METPLSVIFNVVTSFAMILFFIRFMVQCAELDKNEPIVRASYDASRVVDVFTHILPTLYNNRISTSAIFLMFLVRSIDVSGTLALGGLSYNPIQLLYVSLISLISDFFQMCRYLIFASIISSFIVLLTEKSTPIIDILVQVTEPILAPFRKLVPNLGMIDISPMLAFFVFMLADTVLEILSAHLLPLIMSSPTLIKFTLVKVLEFSV